jgi:serine protease AprX
MPRCTTGPTRGMARPRRNPAAPRWPATKPTIAADTAATQDPYGHGTHVASMAAGRGFYQSPDATGVAPNANIYDVRVLNSLGHRHDERRHRRHQLGHVPRPRIQHPRAQHQPGGAVHRHLWRRPAVPRRAHGHRDGHHRGRGGWQLRPQLSAKRSTARSRRRATSLRSSPWVRSTQGPPPRAATTSRQPVQLARPDPGVWVDPMAPTSPGPTTRLKPDLVAPGNKVLGASATSADAASQTKNTLATLFPALEVRRAHAHLRPAPDVAERHLGRRARRGRCRAAVLLQANPGLTPPLVKAILQYTAQPLPGHNLLQQGAGSSTSKARSSWRNRCAPTSTAPCRPAPSAPASTCWPCGKTLPTARSSTIGGQASTGRASSTSAATALPPATSSSPPTSRSGTRARSGVTPPPWWHRAGLLVRHGHRGQHLPEVLHDGWPLEFRCAADQRRRARRRLLGASSLVGKTGVFTPTPTLSWLGQAAARRWARA